MVKVLYLIISDEYSPVRAELGISLAVRTSYAKRYDDFKVLFIGPGEEYITKLEGELAENLRYLIESKTLDSACSTTATSKDIDEKLSLCAERLAYFVNNGYQVITF
jgi:hypothetical protein